MTQSVRGGKREGSGRPKSKSPRIKSSITIEQGLYSWIKSQEESLSGLIESALKLLKREREK
ncbi:hypothetical protein KAU11_03465 [Candidatus Babeliales bacterium]|nr:hypothetical protein [Candidatus Babeliales bacterium]